MCRIALVAHDLTMERLMLQWSEKEDKFIIDSDSEGPEGGLYLSSHSLEKVSLSSTVHQEQYSGLTVELYLKRHWAHYMVVIFLPSMLIVATSWLSFWIDISSPPARVTLCVTTLLAMVTASKQGEQELPKGLPYIKATDLWFAGCILSIFGSLIEYAIVAYTFRAESIKYKERRKIKRSLSSGSICSIDSVAKSSSSLLGVSPRFPHRSSLPSTPQSPRIHFTVSPPDSPDAMNELHELGALAQYKETPQEVATSIDRKSRILFPAAFILFNLIYWSYYN